MIPIDPHASADPVGDSQTVGEIVDDALDSGASVDVSSDHDGLERVAVSRVLVSGIVVTDHFIRAEG